MLQIVRGRDRPLVLQAKRIHVFDYYTVPWEDVPSGTPAAVMIVIHGYDARQDHCFAWHLAAESRGIPAEEIPARQRELERLVLEEFSAFISSHRSATWLHWGMGGMEYGLPALAQRMRTLGVKEPHGLRHRVVDLSGHLKQDFGENYVPHRRLDSLISRNEINPNGLLDVAGLTAAFRAGNYAAMLRSLRRKVGCIKRVLDLYARKELRISPPDAVRSPSHAASGWGRRPAFPSNDPDRNPTGRTPSRPRNDRIDKERQALAALLTIGPNVSRIAREVGVPRTTLLGWPQFRECYERAKEDAERRRRSLRGRRAGDRDFEDEDPDE
jgi:hypothetical protein